MTVKSITAMALEAQANGLKTFDPGIPCKNGHRAHRRALGMMRCVDCIAIDEANTKARREKRIAEKHAAFLAENPYADRIVLRKDAKANNLKFFFTGKPCVQGHFADRLLTTGVCIECKKSWKLKVYKRANRPIRNHVQEAENGELHGRPCKTCGGTLRDKWRKCPLCRKKRNNDPRKLERKREAVKRLRESDVEVARAKDRARYKRDAAIFKAAANRRQQKQKQARPLWITRAQREQMKDFYRNRPDDCHVDHIVPVLGKMVCGLDLPWNLQHLPKKENHAKSNKFPTCQRSMQPAWFDDKN